VLVLPSLWAGCLTPMTRPPPVPFPPALPPPPNPITRTCEFVVLQHEDLQCWCGPVGGQAACQLVGVKVQQEQGRRSGGRWGDAACQAVVGQAQHL
jgi:hypothetical protein